MSSQRRSAYDRTVRELNVMSSRVAVLPVSHVLVKTGEAAHDEEEEEGRSRKTQRPTNN